MREDEYQQARAMMIRALDLLGDRLMAVGRQRIGYWGLLAHVDAIWEGIQAAEKSENERKPPAEGGA